MTIEITILIAIVTFILGILAHWQRGKSEAEEKAKEKAELSTKLDHIDVGVQDIRVQVRHTDNRLNQINERVIKVEESTKSAHKRLDKLEVK